MDQTILDISFWVLFSSALHFVAFTGVTLHALQRRRNASATLLWIFIAWSFPLFGPLLYLSFGIDRIPAKGLKKKNANQLLMRQRDEKHEDESTFVAWHFEYRTPMKIPSLTYSQKLNESLDSIIPEHPFLEGNSVVPLACGDEAYPMMLQAIRSAKNHIHLQSFIIGNDKTSKLFLDELKSKAEEGVKVRLLFDRFGSTHAYLGRLFKPYQKNPNFEICGWTQANPLKRQFQVNLRNHRKNLIVDGHTSFFGGVNLAEENTSTGGRNAIRDYHFKVEGPLVHELQMSFLRDWYFMTKAPSTQLLNEDHFPRMLSVGTAKARLIDSGPSEAPQIAGETFFNTITMAQQQIILVTPYFVPPNDILCALRSAAHRGVDVRIVVPKKNNHRYAGMASKALYEELLEAGVRIFERSPPFIHAKAMVADNIIALVGTANLDIRSLELNYETMALFEDESAIGKLELMLHEDLERSTEITLNEWLQRPKLQKLGENLCSLMTPVL